MTLRTRLLSILLSAMVTASILSLACEKPMAQVPSVTLDWTAPGDDSTTGTASSYQIFYSSVAPDTTGLTTWLNSGGNATSTPAGILTWVNAAKNVNGPLPLAAGSPQSFTINDAFPGGSKYWFMVKTCDEAGNCARSNFAVKTIPTVDTIAPAAIFNLRAR